MSLGRSCHRADGHVTHAGLVITQVDRTNVFDIFAADTQHRYSALDRCEDRGGRSPEYRAQGTREQLLREKLLFDFLHLIPQVLKLLLQFLLSLWKHLTLFVLHMLFHFGAQLLELRRKRLLIGLEAPEFLH